MDAAPAASDLERRKSLRILLRADLMIEQQRYEGRNFYVIKDPVGLRYYRLKENENFLLQFLDGKHTLEEAQKAYEKEFRPERLELESLEAFAQQLLTAGLAQTDSPKAGQQLYRRRKKRRRKELLQKFTNILYIKLPLFDPDKILTGMLGWCGWIFSTWFFTLSVLFMLSAIFLVGTHFETFRSKLPDYHEFFSFKQAINLWIALGAVKIIHEFGHGLSCKRFGGEVHEMGGLLLCFSPALYCNVTDAWVLPNKWHRIIISAAGIYVELVIAAIATWVWWYTPTQPFINNLALSLMIVCSVSTVVFNGNPLMRYDGYYVLADWLEIPNLREKSNRYMSNLVQEHCLGIEVQPEGYMELWRRILFVVYAIVSYLYRWFVSFTILYFFYNWLRPYKLEVLSTMLAAAALASMIGMPLYKLGNSVYRRGRLPDMKRHRVLISAGVVLAIILFLCFVPVPINRVRSVGLVQAHPDNLGQVVVKRTSFLRELKVRPGDQVRAGDVLAVFTDEELTEEFVAARFELADSEKHLALLERQKADPSLPAKARALDPEIASVRGKIEELKATIREKELALKDLTVVAPRSGVVGQGPGPDDLGKQFQASKDQQQPTLLFTIIEPGKVRVCLPLVTPEFNQLREGMAHHASQRRRTGQSEDLPATIRVHGLDSTTWDGRVSHLDQQEARFIPLLLSNKAGGPVAVQAKPGANGQLIPLTQHYLVYVDIEAPEGAIVPGAFAQVKVYCKSETMLKWTWRMLNDTFNLRLLWAGQRGPRKGEGR